MNLSPEDVNRFKKELLEFSDYDFSGYSIKSFTRRLNKILEDNNMTLDTLLRKMRKKSDFLEYVIKEITVNTTEPFRTPEIWKQLIPIMENKFADEKELNFWHAGCSNGLEVYSMLIILYEMHLFDKVNVVGTDLNPDMLKIAREGRYRLHDFEEYMENIEDVMKVFPNFNILNYLKINTRKKWVKIEDFLTRKPVFVRHNLVKDGNVFNKKFNLIMCRNVLIYFDQELQDRLFHFFYESLTEEGILVIGKHESILSPIQRKFDRIDSIYIKKRTLDYFN